MRMKWSFGFAVLAACVFVVGCGEEKKPDAGGSSGDAKNSNPSGEKPAKAPTAGEAKYKLTTKEFIKEFATGGRAASAKYSGAIVELTGHVMRSAGVEIDDFGKPLGQPGAYKISFVFGQPDAKRVETIIVRGLNPSVVGQVLRGQDAHVKGRVGQYQPTDPIELLDAELLSPGADVSTPWDQDWSPDKAKVVCTKVSGTVNASGKEGEEDYVDVKSYKGQLVRCYLLAGTKLLFPSELAPGTKITFAGMESTGVINKGTPLAGVAPVLHEAVPVGHRDPKAK